MSGMKECYSEGMANHASLGSYACISKDAGGTLIEVRADRVLAAKFAKEPGAADFFG